MKTKKPLFNMDERNKQLALSISTVMYLFTLISLGAVLIYRQFVLKQDISNFEDVAIIMTVNSLFLLSAFFYFGVFSVKKLKIKTILIVYLGFVIIGSVFTYVKYNILEKGGLSITEMFDKIIIIASITGIISLFFIVFTILGKRRLEKEIEED